MSEHQRVRFLAFTTALAFGLSLWGTGPAQAQTLTGNVNVVVGQRLLNDDWDPLERQGQLGIDFDIRRQDWPVNLAFGVSRSHDDSRFSFVAPGVSRRVKVEADLVQLDLGVKKLYDAHRLPFTPFVGLGLSLLMAELDADVIDDDDTAFGGWISGGAYITLANHFNLGAQLKWSKTADVSLFGEDFNTSSFHWGLFAGYHW
jgi:hypothetical protein